MSPISMRGAQEATIHFHPALGVLAVEEYGPLEDDCNQLEDQLSGQDYDLTGN
jgi:hypothetical protein